jgi:hypothetical protein
MIPGPLRREVIQRAGNRCEYCGLSQAGQEATFHIDHIDPVAAGGPTTLENLALACVSCSLRKGAATRVLDPQSAVEVPIFNPRLHQWSDHFRWNDVEVLPLTATGAATVIRLQLNRPMALAIRQEEKLRQRHPPLRAV